MDEKACQIVRILRALETLREKKAELIRQVKAHDYGTTAQSFIMQPNVLNIIRREAQFFVGKHRAVIRDAGCLGPEDLVGYSIEKYLGYCDRNLDKLEKISTALTVIIGRTSNQDVLRKMMAYKRQSNMFTKDIATARNKNPQTGAKGFSILDETEDDRHIGF